MMHRRIFVTGLALGALAPVRARAQTPARAPRLGVLLYSDPGADPNMRAFRERIRELGWAEGGNLVVEYRYAEGHPERLPELAADLVRTRPDAIFAIGGDVAPFARDATRTIPIVFATSGDPVRGKLVTSVASPGGNITGVTLLTSDLAPKRLQFLKEAAPKISRVGVLRNPEHADDEYRLTEAAAQAAGIDVLSLEGRDAGLLDAALHSPAAARIDGLFVVPSRATVLSRDRIVEIAGRRRLPLAGGWGLWADAGALLSYGPQVNVMMRGAADYVDRVLKGARPADLPVQQPTTFELVVNLKTARTLGLTPPPSLLARADRVIE
jgi:putative ABC transport system substrate-binding protein